MMLKNRIGGERRDLQMVQRDETDKWDGWRKKRLTGQVERWG